MNEGLRAQRDARRFGKQKKGDSRTGAQRDRDRILYSSAFRRLGGVTQVVWAREEGHLFHNRLTHTLKVAQVARRLAERLQAEAPNGDFLDRLGGIDPDATEAAAMAHDLGHPPFGHVGENELAVLCKKAGAPDGFEGNAQSFRIVVRLAAISQDFAGLDLTRGTLNGILKYPQVFEGSGKYGVYLTDKDAFDWAREGTGLSPGQLSLDAQVMDWADDITYAVHDVEDFYRSGLIPTARLARLSSTDLEPLFALVDDRWEAKFGSKPTGLELENAAAATLSALPQTQPFRGSLPERALLRISSSALINRFVQSSTIHEKGLRVDRPQAVEVGLLKQLTGYFVIRDPALSTQQVGQRRIIRDLFGLYLANITPNSLSVLPARFAEAAEDLLARGVDAAAKARLVADAIASMTETQAVRLHGRLTGSDLGSFLDPAVT